MPAQYTAIQKKKKDHKKKRKGKGEQATMRQQRQKLFTYAYLSRTSGLYLRTMRRHKTWLSPGRSTFPERSTSSDMYLMRTHRTGTMHSFQCYRRGWMAMETYACCQKSAENNDVATTHAERPQPRGEYACMVVYVEKTVPSYQQRASFRSRALTLLDSYETW